MAVVGTAYVNIRAITDKLRGDIESGLSGSNGAAQKAGEQIGDDLVAGARARISNVQLGDDFDFSGVHDAASRGTDGVGAEMASKIKNDFESGGSDIERAAEDIGDSGGRGLGNRFAAGVSGSGASGALSGLVIKILALGPVIAVAVSALSSLVSGLFALAAAVAPAVASLAVLPGILAAIGQAAITGVVAFGGIGTALKAGTKALSAGGAAAGAAGNAAAAAARQQERATQAVKAAQEGLAQAYQDAGDRQIASAENVKRAYQDLTQAQKDAKDAQLAINTARQDAIEQMQQLDFNVEESVLAEKRAAIELQKQRENYARFLDLPPDNRLREQALLALQQADLNFREATDKAADLQKAQDDSNKKGVEGSDLVVNAKQKEVDAEQQLADAKQNVNDQLRAQLRAQQQSQQQIEHAQQSLHNAQQDLADSLKKTGAAAGGAGGAANAYALALSKLSKPAQNFVKYLISIQGTLRKVKDQAGADLFPLLTKSLKTVISSGVLKDLGNGLQGTGKQLGLFALGIANLTKDPFFRGNFNATLKSNNTVLGEIRQAIVPLVSAFFALTAAAAPTTEAFARFIKIKAQAIAGYTGVGNSAKDAAAKQAHLRDVIEDGANVAKQIGRIFSNVASALFALGQNARPAGQSLLDSLEKVTKRFKDFTQNPANDDRVKKYFEDVATNVKAVMSALGALTAAFGRLGDEPGVKKVADTLKNDIIPALEDVFTNFTNKYGPQLADTFDSVLAAFKGFADSPAFKVALGIIKAFADTLTFIVETPGLRQIAFTVLTAVAAIKTIQKIGDFIGLKKLVGYFDSIKDFQKKRVLKGVADDAAAAAGATPTQSFGSGVGNPVAAGSGAGKAGKTAKAAVKVEGAEAAAKDIGKVEKASTGLGGSLKGLLGGFGFLIGPVGIVLAAVAGLALVLYGAYKNSKDFRDAVDKIGAGIKPVAAAIGKFASGALKAVGDFIANVIIPAIGRLVTSVLPSFRDAFKRVSDTINDNRDTFETIGEVLKKVGEIFVTIIIPIAAKLIAQWIKIIVFIDSTLIQVLIRLITFIVNMSVTIITVAVSIVKAFIAVGTGITKAFNVVVSAVVTAVAKVISVIASIKSAVGRVAGSLFDGIKTAIKTVVTYVGDRISDIIAKFSGVKTRISRAASGMWDGIKDAFKAVINSIIGWWNNLAFTLKIPSNLITKAAHIAGQGFSIGTPDIPRLASGGTVAATPGGQLIQVAEAGKPERITPLGPDGLTDGERAILAALRDNKNAGVLAPITVNPSPGMDEEQLAHRVAARLGWELKTV